MTNLDYNNKNFVSVQNSESGEVSSKTVFRYRQKDSMVWAEYSGGKIVYGNLVGKCDDEGNLDFRYQHLNTEGELMAGICNSKPEFSEDGRIRLFEKWCWTTGDRSTGESIIEEVK